MKHLNYRSFSIHNFEIRMENELNTYLLNVRLPQKLFKKTKNFKISFEILNSNTQIRNIKFHDSRATLKNLKLIMNKNICHTRPEIIF